MSSLRRLLRLLGVDHTVAVALVGHLWTLASGPLLLGLVLWKLQVAERGALFNFVSICQFQILFEIGTATVVQQLASREKAFLQMTARGTLAGDPAAKARLAGLFRHAVGWFLGVMLVVNLLLVPGGWAFFATAKGLDGVDWQAAWVLSAMVAAGQGFAYSLFQFLSGCGDVTPVVRVTALQNALMPLAQALALLAGTRLLSHPIAGATGLAVSLGWMALRRRAMLADLWRADRGAGTFRWRTDLWPLQWRSTLSILGLVAVNQMLNPLVLAFHGGPAAGRVGLSAYILMMIQMMGTLWMQTKAPLYGGLAATKRWADLDRLFRGALVRSLALVAVLSALAVGADVILHHWRGTILESWLAAALPAEWMDSLRGMDQPLVDPWAMALLAVATTALHVPASQAALLRAHRREPMLPVYLALAAATAVGVSLAGWLGTPRTMIAAYTASALAIGLGAGTWVFVRRRAEWHRDEPA